MLTRVHFLLIASLLLPTFFLHSSAEQGRGSDQEQEADKWPQNNPGTLNVSNDLPWVKPVEDDSTSAETNSQESWEQSAEVIEADGQEGDHKSKNSKWPQNYPGGGGGGNFHPNKGRGPFFPGHIGHWPGRHEWEDENGHNREHQGKRGEGGHHGNDRRQEKGWLDWIFPWRKSHHNRHNKNGTDSEENDDGNHSNSTRHRNESVLVHLRGGPVRGLVSYAAGPHRPANVFKGIPFAEPPIGKLRFKPLQKKRAWKRVWDATKYTAACLSNTTRTRSPQHYISEDCIYVNVFADPKCHEGKPCPVLFYVHGGGFAYDSATMFNDTQIVQKYASDGVVFLIPAYRLGLFGFLDLGSDRTVKRNLGLHDIIFALSWTRREVRAFGGDPERITIMGNSAGASAVQYLCASPAVEEKHFQQAIISSGVPFFVPNANLNQTYELLDHFNCLRHNSTNHTLSDKEKADCLREQNATELLRAQQRNEERGIVFSGPETDSELLPAKNYVELLRHWTARPVIYSTTKNEFARWPENRMRAECWKALIPLGYSSQSAFQACMDRYNQSFFVEEDMRVSYESMHAESFLTSLVNTRLGGISYVGEFELTNYSNHADDLYFFFGLHYIPLNTTDSKLMDIYYPKMIKNFLRGHAPDQDWKPQNWNGRNFFRIAFNVSQNGTLLETPHGVDGYQDIDGLQFWLRDMAVVERNARWQKAARQMHGGSKRGPGNLTESEERTWREVFGDGGNRTLAANETTIAEEEKKKKGNKQRRHLSPLPMANSFMALPPIDEVEEEEENGTSTNADANEMEEGIPEQNAALDSSSSTPQSTDAPASDMPSIPVVDDQQRLSPMPLETANSDNLENEEKVEAAGRELSKVWSAFWLTISITVLLSVAMVLMVVTKVVHRYKNVRGYSPAPDGTGMFSEKTRIIQANGNNNHMRYI